MGREEEITLFQEVAAGATLLTANRRLSRHLANHYDAWQASQGRTVWPTAVILPLTAWWTRLHHELLTNRHLPTLLTPQQERLLWETIIAASDPGQGLLLGLPRAAARCQEAWTLLRQARVTLPPDEAVGNLEAEAFLAWSHTFDQQTRERTLLPGAALPELLLTRLQELALPERVTLAGFDQLTPQEEHFFATLARTGVTVTRHPFPDCPGSAHRVALADGEAELHTVARWCRALLEENPHTRIGVVLPAPQARHGALLRAFTQVLDPGAWHPLIPVRPLPFNLSLGRPLAHAPLIRDGLALLALAAGESPRPRWGELLASPFVAGGESERTPRARLDARLGSLGLTAPTPGLVRRLALESGECPVLARLLAELPRREGGDHPPGHWAITFSRELTRWGWPGERGLGSVEHQTLAAWRDLLATLATFDGVSAPLTRGKALSLLTRLATETLFQPETPETPIQILGVLEAGGERFDALWVAGLHDQAWPPTPEPNPFLPMGWQRRQDLPRASASRELAVAQRITRRLLAAAPRVMVSHGRQEGEQRLRPSPLITHLPELDAALLPLSPLIPPLPAPLESQPDDLAPPLAPGEPVRGGSGLLQSQSLCPFQAFARYRLGARIEPEGEPGLDARLRGELVHHLLQRFWSETGQSAALAALTGEARQERAQQLAAEVVATLAAHPNHQARFTPRVAALEQERLARLLLQWLVWEEQRPAAFQVAEMEKDFDVTVAGLPLSVRLDRVDRLAGGELAILDYKTGEVRARAWDGERPPSPQLPLYALALGDEPVAAVAFARLATGRSGFIGLASRAGVLPGLRVSDDWEGQLRQWQEALERLAGEFQQGVATVTPHPEADPCRLCDLPLLCRKSFAIGEVEAGSNGQESPGD